MTDFAADASEVQSEQIRAAQSGDAAAFSRLLESVYDTMYRFAYRWSGNPTDAEDIAQLACIKLARSIGQFRFEAAFSSWLYRLVINCAKDWLKSESRHHDQAIPQNEDGSPQEDWAGRTEHTAEKSIYLNQVLMRLDGMAEGFKETALLVYSEGLSHAEAADILQIKESTVSWRLHEIRKQLQQWQQADGDSWEATL